MCVGYFNTIPSWSLAKSTVLPLIGTKVTPDLHHDFMWSSPTPHIPGSSLPHKIQMSQSPFGFPGVLDIKFPEKIVLRGLVIDTIKGSHVQAFTLESAKFEHLDPMTMEPVQVKEDQTMVSQRFCSCGQILREYICRNLTCSLVKRIHRSCLTQYHGGSTFPDPW